MDRVKQNSGLSRRQFLTAVGVGAGTLALSSCGPLLSQTPTPTRSLPSFPRAAGTGRIRDYTFEANQTEAMFGAKKATTWAYNGVIPGPEIRLVEGDTLRVTVKNRLPQDTSIHWHGIPLVNSMDGVPNVTQAPIKPGQDYVYQFLAPTAGTYLYHSHVGLQLDRGLYGPLIIDPAKEVQNYDEDFVLTLDDWLDGMPGTPENALQQLIAGGDRMGSMNGPGSMEYTNNGMPAVIPPDLVYPLYLINGKPGDDPFILNAKRGQKARLRFINASSATIYHIALQGHRMTVTHADGQPVEPVEVDTLRIGMGERYDVLVSFTNPGVWQLAAVVEGAKSMVRAIVRYQGSTTATPPAMLQPSELVGQMLLYRMLKVVPGSVVPPRSGSPDVTLPITLSGGNGQYVWKINNQVFPNASSIPIEQMRWIRFQFTNMSMMPHPMHLHGHFFQLENGTGRGPLKDTVIVDAMQRLTINWVSNNPGSWAFHCHNAYHLDTGMMRVVNVK